MLFKLHIGVPSVIIQHCDWLNFDGLVDQFNSIFELSVVDKILSFLVVISGLFCVVFVGLLGGF